MAPSLRGALHPFESVSRRLSMSMFWVIGFVILWLVVLLLAFLLLGALRALGLLSWRLEQLEATTPKRLGRDGLKPGKKAPDFTLPCVSPSPPTPLPPRERGAEKPPSPTGGRGEGGATPETSFTGFARARAPPVFTQ